MAAGPPHSASASVFHGDDHEQTTEYRSLSVLAVLGLVISLIAWLAYLGPFLIVVPLAGIAISLLALRQIAVSEGVLAGRWAATVGLVLSVVFAVLPLSHYVALKTMRMSEAEAFSRRWVDLVTSGKMEDAFHLTVDSTRPATPPAEPGAHPGPGTLAGPAPYQLFLDQPIIKALKAAGPGADVRLVDTVEYKPDSYRMMTVKQLYSVTPAASAGAAQQPTEFVVTVVRGVLPRDQQSRWMISRCDPKTAENSSPAK